MIENMQNLNYLETMKRQYLLNNENLIDILEHIGYIARDNGLDDSVCDEIIDAIENGEVK